MEPTEDQDGLRADVGCAFKILLVNAILMSLVAISFIQGPYSSHEQELFYRYGSIAFLFAGAVIPALAMQFGVKRSRVGIIALAVWMVGVLLAFLQYVGYSRGGV